MARHPPFSEDVLLKLFLSFSGSVSVSLDPILGGTLGPETPLAAFFSLFETWSHTQAGLAWAHIRGNPPVSAFYVLGIQSLPLPRVCSLKASLCYREASLKKTKKGAGEMAYVGACYTSMRTRVSP